MPIDIKCLRADQGGDPAYWIDIQKKRFKPDGLVERVLELDTVRNVLLHSSDHAMPSHVAQTSSLPPWLSLSSDCS